VFDLKYNERRHTIISADVLERLARKLKTQHTRASAVISLTHASLDTCTTAKHFRWLTQIQDALQAARYSSADDDDDSSKALIKAVLQRIKAVLQRADHAAKECFKKLMEEEGCDKPSKAQRKKEKQKAKRKKAKEEKRRSKPHDQNFDANGSDAGPDANGSDAGPDANGSDAGPVATGSDAGPTGADSATPCSAPKAAKQPVVASRFYSAPHKQLRSSQLKRGGYKVHPRILFMHYTIYSLASYSCTVCCTLRLTAHAALRLTAHAAHLRLTVYAAHCV
jgi:hypothetical protein